MINYHALLPFSDPNYQHPTYKDVRTLRLISKMTKKELATLAGCDERSISRWCSEVSRTGIPYASWRLLLIELGLIDPLLGRTV